MKVNGGGNDNEAWRCGEGGRQEVGEKIWGMKAQGRERGKQIKS